MLQSFGLYTSLSFDQIISKNDFQQQQPNETRRRIMCCALLLITCSKKEEWILFLNSKPKPIVESTPPWKTNHHSLCLIYFTFETRQGPKNLFQFRFPLFLFRPAVCDHDSLSASYINPKS